MEQGARIVPVLVGTQDQGFWQGLVQKADLHEFGEIPEVAEVASSGNLAKLLERHLSASAPPSLLLLLVDENGLTAASGRRLSEVIHVTERRRKIGRHVMVVVPRDADIEKLRDYIHDVAIETAEQPEKVRGVVASKLSPTEVGGEPTSSAARGTATPFGAAQQAAGPGTPSSSSAQSSRGDPRPSKEDDDPETAEEGGAAPVRFDDLHQDEFTGLAWRILQATRRFGVEEYGLEERYQGHAFVHRSRSDVASVRHLLAAILLSGSAPHSRPAEEEGPHTGTWLLMLCAHPSEAIKQLAELFPVLRQYEESFDSILSRERGIAAAMTARLREVIDLARRLAKESQAHDPEARVGARHLLGAAVRRAETDTNVGPFLRAFGLDAGSVRTSMISSLQSWDLLDDPEVWRRLLDPVPDLATERTVPTYASDSVAGPDWIGITREVEAMASLVSAWSVEPPLSIGLFGEWGSGKSFFMQKMKERVRQISREARKSGDGQKKFGYYKNIVQVEFNAWHYVEGNLWASLVEHIFANLKLEAADGEDVDSEQNIGRRLQRLLGEVREKSAEAEKLDDAARALTEAATKKQEEAEERAIALEAEAKAAQEQAKAADRERADAQRLAEEAQREAEAKAEERRKIGLKDLLEEVVGSQELREEVRQGLEKLGITRERLQTVEDLRGAMREATDAGTLISRGVRILRKEGQPWRLLLLVLIVPALIAGTTLFVGWLADQQGSPWLQSVIGVVSAVSAVPAFLVGAWKMYRPKLEPVLKTIEDLRRKRAELEARVEEARRRRSEKAAELDKEAEGKKSEADAHRQRASEKRIEAETERQAAMAKQAEAVAMGEKADQARRDAAKLAQEADLLRPERRIATFIQDRAAAKDYRQHLGIPAIIRRDFQKLEAMFRTQREVEDIGKDGLDVLSGESLNGRNDPSVVNRIILYIDDLDRCPPKKVVEVLQAIHLLLAFPLFVVIVAVDARWMKRSLRDQFTLMLSGDDGKSNGSPETSREKDPHLGSTATPDDYLEKIFQVPFWIRPLGPTASQNLVRELTRNDLSTPDAGPSRSEKSTTETWNRSKTPAPETPAPVEEEGKTGDVQPAQQANVATSSGVGEHSPSSLSLSWSPVEPRPRTLQLSEEERNYMISLATVIGRSPRSVKRFVNCYRLAKMTLEPADLARSSRDGTFRTTMLLLGIVSGMPEIAPDLLSNLRSTDPTKSPAAWAREATEKLRLEERGKWGDLLPVIQNLEQSGIRSIAPLAAAADHVDRFSFNPARSTLVREPHDDALARPNRSRRSR